MRANEQKIGMKMRKTTPTFTAYCVLLGTVFLGLEWNIAAETPRDIAQILIFPYSSPFFWSLGVYIFLIRLNEIRLKQQTGEGKKNN